MASEIPTADGRDAAGRVTPRANLAAIRAACEGLIVGVGVRAALGTSYALSSSGIEAGWPSGWLGGAVLVFAGELIWGLIGGALFLLPPSALFFFAFAKRALASGAWPPPTRLASLVLWSTLLVPLLVFGPGGRRIEGLLLGVSLWIGIRHGFRRLAVMLAPR